MAKTFADELETAEETEIDAAVADANTIADDRQTQIITDDAAGVTLVAAIGNDVVANPTAVPSGIGASGVIGLAVNSLAAALIGHAEGEAASEGSEGELKNGEIPSLSSIATEVRATLNSWLSVVVEWSISAKSENSNLIETEGVLSLETVFGKSGKPAVWNETTVPREIEDFMDQFKVNGTYFISPGDPFPTFNTPSRTPIYDLHTPRNLPDFEIAFPIL